MTLAQLRAAFHPDTLTEVGASGNESCFYVQSKGHRQFSFMIMNGRVARIDVTRSGVSTASGIQVGDSEAETIKTYGSGLKVEPHAYSAPDGHYLTIRSKDGRYGLRFETYKGKIESFYAGRSDAIQYIEGCD